MPRLLPKFPVPCTHIAHLCDQPCELACVNFFHSLVRTPACVSTTLLQGSSHASVFSPVFPGIHLSAQNFLFYSRNARVDCVMHFSSLPAHAQIKRCKTDAYDGLQFDNPDRPECTNLLTLYQLATGRSKEEVATECGPMRWGQFKPLLADALVEHLRPVQTRCVQLHACMCSIKRSCT